MNDPVMKAINDFLVMPDRPDPKPGPSYPANDSFDPWDDDLFHDICGKRLAKPVQELLLLLEQMDMTKESFGVNPDRFMELAVKKLKMLREGCIEAFQEL